MSRPAVGVCGIGVDIVELTRFSAFLARNESHLSEIYTQRELDAADDGGRRDLYLATRWALKEAAFKALGTGWGKEMQWTEVEALGSLLQPQIRLRGAARETAEAGGVRAALGAAASSGDSVIAWVALTDNDRLYAD